MPRITKTLVNKIRPKGSARRQYFWDDDLRGFGVAVYGSAGRATSSSTGTARAARAV